METLRLVNSWSEDCRIMEKYIRGQARPDATLQILEAGCGRNWPIDLQGIRFRLTGVDLSEKLLKMRKSNLNDLHDSIVGDLRFVNLEPNRYDVIYNSYVLEHIPDADHVLDNFNRWLKPGGILILRIPDRNSVWGFVTRFTPDWFHKFHHRYIRGIRNPEDVDVGPFPTVHDRVVSREGIHEFCRKNQFTMKEEHGHTFYLNGLGAVGTLMYMFVRGMNLLSLGALAWKHNDLTYVLEKVGAQD
jgi:SAM-dependent methyltransferase